MHAHTLLFLDPPSAPLWRPASLDYLGLKPEEGGDFLFGGASKTILDSCLKYSSKSCRTLCVIGGVRDMHPAEVRALENAASNLNLSMRIVSFGNKPELK